MGQLKMKYWELQELHKNEVKKCIPNEHMPKNVNFEQLLKHILRAFLSLGGNFNSLWLAHSGSQPFIYTKSIILAEEEVQVKSFCTRDVLPMSLTHICTVSIGMQI